jgi:hypothetical protein
MYEVFSSVGSCMNSDLNKHMLGVIAQETIQV